MTDNFFNRPRDYTYLNQTMGDKNFSVQEYARATYHYSRVFLFPTIRIKKIVYNKTELGYMFAFRQSGELVVFQMDFKAKNLKLLNNITLKQNVNQTHPLVDDTISTIQEINLAFIQNNLPVFIQVDETQKAFKVNLEYVRDDFISTHRERKNIEKRALNAKFPVQGKKKPEGFEGQI